MAAIMSDGIARADLRGRKLGVLLSTDPGHPNLDTCLELAGAALARGVDLYLYLIDDGVRALADDRVQELARRGAKLFACAFGCQRRRLPITGEGATYCGLVVLTDLINGCDRFVALN
ncbi:MAG TPA: DsrE family protein [Methylomirabilota bacterium]|nr:DsrE family protein [Methylomirabilota bacterium]